MKTRLTNSLEQKQKDQIEHEFKVSHVLRGRMKELLLADVDNIHRLMREDAEHHRANWPYKQAEKIGEVKAILKLISLLE